MLIIIFHFITHVANCFGNDHSSNLFCICISKARQRMDHLMSATEKLKYQQLGDSMVSIYSFFDLHLSQSARISICSDFDLHGFRSAIQNIFQSARISICTVFALQFLDLQRFRSAQYSICTDFDLHGFRSTCISICKSILDLWIFRSANQISIYRFFNLQIKFRSTDFSICKSSFDLQIF